MGKSSLAGVDNFRFLSVNGLFGARRQHQEDTSFH
jgi:hypothetical protein